MTTPVLVPVPGEPDVKDVTVDSGVTFVVSKKLQRKSRCSRFLKTRTKT